MNIKNLWNRIRYFSFYVWWKHQRNPENIWYGGSLKRETALRSVGEGWSEIINNLYDAKPKETKVVQVKEKYSSLRFYVECAPEWYEDLIIYYEGKSCTICERCGKPGKCRTDIGWYLTLCDDHYQESKNEIEKYRQSNVKETETNVKESNNEC